MVCHILPQCDEARVRRSLELGPEGTLLTCCHGLIMLLLLTLHCGSALPIRSCWHPHHSAFWCCLTVLRGPAAAKALTGPHNALQSFYLLARKAAPSSTQHPHATASEQSVFWNLSTCGKCTLPGSLPFFLLSSLLLIMAQAPS